MLKNKYVRVLFVMLLIQAALFIIALSFGAKDIPFNDVIGFLTGSKSNDNTLVLKEIRLPRVLGALLVGIALSVAGAIMQGMTKNPLASPSIFGVTAGATVLIAILYAFSPNVNNIMVLIFSLLGAFLAALLVFTIGISGKYKMNTSRIVLAGSAISVLLYSIADIINIKYGLAKEISMWSNSGLIGVTYRQLLMVTPIIVLCSFTAIFYSKKLTLLSIDEELALSLGVNVRKLRTILFFLITLLSGAAVAIGGNIVFIGLVVPHIARQFVGKDYVRIIPASIIIGGSFMMFSDLIARTVNAPYETPVTAVLSVLSFPVFLYVVKKGESVL